MGGSKRADIAKSIPNALSAVRIPLSLLLLLVKPFSSWFVAIYIACGATDALDGLCARKLHAESDFGAKLDSVADFTFFAASLYTFLTALLIPPIVLMWALTIVFLRAAGLTVAFGKFRSWAALHTNAFKVTSFVFFCFPLLHATLGAFAAGGVMCLVATAATGEEIYINLCSESLDPDIRSARQLHEVHLLR